MGYWDSYDARMERLAGARIGEPPINPPEWPTGPCYYCGYDVFIPRDDDGDLICEYCLGLEEWGDE